MKQVLFLIIFFIEFVQVCIPSKTILVREDKESKGENIRNRYNQVLHLTQDINGNGDKLTVIHHKREQRGQSFPSR